MSKFIVLLPGDGIGVEVVGEAKKIIDYLSERYGMGIRTGTYLVGGASLDSCNEPVKDEVIEACLKADAVLLGAVGGPKWDNNPRRQTSGESPAATAQGARPVQQPATGHRL
jgi:3-isopropylmalate dehydrogenase